LNGSIYSKRLLNLALIGATKAKRYKNTVGVSAVRDLFGTMINEGANKGILVTTSSYGPDAYEFAKDKPIELVDGGGLLYLLEQVGIKARIIFPEEANPF
jgi:restriction system protein